MEIAIILLIAFMAFAIIDISKLHDQATPLLNLPAGKKEESLKSEYFPHAVLCIKGVPAASLQPYSERYGFYIREEKDHLLLLTKGEGLEGPDLCASYFFAILIGQNFTESRMYLDLIDPKKKEFIQPIFLSALMISERANKISRHLFRQTSYSTRELELIVVNMNTTLDNQKVEIDTTLLRLMEQRLESVEESRARNAVAESAFARNFPSRTYKEEGAIDIQTPDEMIATAKLTQADRKERGLKIVR